MKKTAACVVLAVFFLGCEDPLKPAERIDEPRVLGVRVSTVTADATLVPGEPASAQVLLAGPTGALAAQLAYRLCLAVDSQRGVPYCDGEAFAEGTLDASAAIDFQVPPSLAPGARLALLGAACTSGEPALAENPRDFSCGGLATPLRFSFDAWTLADEVNANPDLSAAFVTLGGEGVELVEASASPRCDAADAFEVAAGAAHLLELDLGEGARESRETLQVSHFSTAGDYERQFSFVGPEQAPRLSLTWQAPVEVGPVTQFLVVRDGRGGVSWLTWSLCVR
jgi:hypothetical protein